MKKWKVAGAKVQGRGHIKHDIPCQDALFSEQQSTFAVASLADGAGSYKYSHIGAELVTTTVCHILEKYFNSLYKIDNESAANRIFNYLNKKLDEKANELDIDKKQLSSTLLFVAVMDNQRFLAGHIGDGCIGYIDPDGVNVLSHPDNGEFPNVTFFLTSESSRGHMRIYKGELEDKVGFIIMSDGGADNLYSRQEQTLSKVVNNMLSWLDNNLQYHVSGALEKNMAELFTKRTPDDCSVNLLKLTNKNIDDLNQMTIEQLKEFFSKRNKTNVVNKLKILNVISSVQNANEELIVKQSGLSLKSVKRHLKDLISMGYISIEQGIISIN